MAKNPSTRWFFNDWANEPGLRLCSVSARGLWMDMLCIAAASDRPGYVEIDGKPCTVRDLARYSNAPPSNIRRWLAELEEHGVFSRDEAGVVFNRRMVREASDPESTAREHGGNQGENGDDSRARSRARSRDSDSDSLPLNSPLNPPSEKGDLVEQKNGKGSPRANGTNPRASNPKPEQPETISLPSSEDRARFNRKYNVIEASK